MNLKPFLYGLGFSLASATASAEVIDVEITNLTQGIYFTPFLVAAHDSSIYFYQVGEEASDALATMAEGGDISLLSGAVTGAGGAVVENPAGGLLAPAMTTTTTDFDTGDNGYLSIAAMLLPTNDGFAGLNSWPIPSEPGTYTINLSAYDAGSEANDEILNSGAGGALGVSGIPAAPGGDAGSGATGVTTTETNETVHIHRGNLGDTDPDGGVSDVDSTVHRWLNPVVRVVVTVQ